MMLIFFKQFAILLQLVFNESHYSSMRKEGKKIFYYVYVRFIHINSLAPIMNLHSHTHVYTLLISPLLVCGPYSKTGFSHFNVDLSSSVRVLFKMHASAKPYRSVYDCFFPRLQCQKYPTTTTCS